MKSRCPYANHDQITAHILYTLAVVFVSVAGVYAQQASEPAIGLKADRVLQDMSDYLARSDRFGVAAPKARARCVGRSRLQRTDRFTFAGVCIGVVAAPAFLIVGRSPTSYVTNRAPPTRAK